MTSSQIKHTPSPEQNLDSCKKKTYIDSGMYIGASAKKSYIDSGMYIGASEKKSYIDSGMYMGASPALLAS